MDEVDQLTALRSAEGAAIFSALNEPANNDPLRATTQLRAAGHDPALIAAALSQRELRAKATSKFGAVAADMFFSAQRLEQASRSIVSAHRARKLVSFGAHSVLDIGCGIGGDLAAFARAGLRTTGLEIDVATANLAAANMAALNLTAQVRVGSATTVDLSAIASQFDAAFCDPARRAAGKRIFDPNAYSPPWAFVTELVRSVAITCVKVAPGIHHDAIQALPTTTHAEWVSADGTLVEAALWTGVKEEHPHSATVLRTGKEPATIHGRGTRDAPVGTIGTFLYDPDDAVTRAHLIAELATRLDARLIDPRIAYLSNGHGTTTPFARCYRVVEILPFSVKRLRARLAALDVGVVEIKKRGFAMTPEQLRPVLKLKGVATMTVVLTRVGDTPTAILCQPAT